MFNAILLLAQVKIIGNAAIKYYSVLIIQFRRLKKICHFVFEKRGLLFTKSTITSFWISLN